MGATPGAHPMTFQEALKKLTEREPEKFEWWGDECENLSWQGGQYLGAISPDGRVTQDDIDEIAALIGYYYEIVTVPPDIEHLPEPQWGYIAHKVNDPYCNCIHSYPPPFVTKLEAAKAALIAIVEAINGR